MPGCLHLQYETIALTDWCIIAKSLQIISNQNLGQETPRIQQNDQLMHTNKSMQDLLGHTLFSVGEKLTSAASWVKWGENNERSDFRHWINGWPVSKRFTPFRQLKSNSQRKEIQLYSLIPIFNKTSEYGQNLPRKDLRGHSAQGWSLSSLGLSEWPEVGFVFLCHPWLPRTHGHWDYGYSQGDERVSFVLPLLCPTMTCSWLI